MRAHRRGLDGRTVARRQTGKSTAVAGTAVDLPEPKSARKFDRRWFAGGLNNERFTFANDVL